MPQAPFLSLVLAGPGFLRRKQQLIDRSRIRNLISGDNMRWEGLPYMTWEGLANMRWEGFAYIRRGLISLLVHFLLGASLGLFCGFELVEEEKKGTQWCEK